MSFLLENQESFQSPFSLDTKIAGLVDTVKISELLLKTTIRLEK